MGFVIYTGFLGVKAFTTDRSVDFLKGANAGEGYDLSEGQTFALQAGGVICPGRLTFPKQVHGGDIWLVGQAEAGQRGLVEADALITNVPGLPIAVRTADCLPLLLIDPVMRVVAAVHAGWKSARLHIAAKTLAMMTEKYDVDPLNVRAAIGPCIRKECFQVGPEFKKIFPLDVIPARDGLYMDLAGTVMRQLLVGGVGKENIFDCGLCSVTDSARFFSYRREAECAGRLLSVIVL